MRLRDPQQAQRRPQATTFAHGTIYIAIFGKETYLAHSERTVCLTGSHHSQADI